MNFINYGTAIIFFLFLSCNTTEKIAGVYEIEKNNVMAANLYLNPDGTFAEYLDVSHCGPMWFFGRYHVKGNIVNFELFSSQINYYNKVDTIVYNFNTTNDDKGIFLVENSQFAVDSAMIFDSNNNLVGITNSMGYLKMDNLSNLDSLIIKKRIGVTHKLKVFHPYKFNQMFVSLYDYLFEPCTKFSFRNSLFRKKNGLYFFHDWEQKGKMERISLKKRENIK